ncbi:MAG TPA: ParB/RepB/Spo0J family partition protein [Chloroflexia bacterium]|nr:ParB/RepB/Spo0J family partition protein [Chloroflexia bacterium]
MRSKKAKPGSLVLEASADDLFGFDLNVTELASATDLDLNLAKLPTVAELRMTSTSPKVFRGIELLRVPLELIRPNPHQYRQEITPESVADLVEQFRERGPENGLEQFPKATTAEEEGQTVYILISGHRRRAAWEIAFGTNEPMPLAVKPGLSDKDLIFGGLAENISREPLSEVEYARAFKALLDSDPTLNLRKLGDLFKRNKSTVSRMLQLLELPEQLQEENRLGRLTLRTGVALTRFSKLHGATEYAYQRALSEGLTAEAVEKAGWELLRTWPGWETNPMPPEAEAALAPKIYSYGTEVAFPQDQDSVQFVPPTVPQVPQLDIQSPARALTGPVRSEADSKAWAAEDKNQGHIKIFQPYNEVNFSHFPVEESGDEVKDLSPVPSNQTTAAPAPTGQSPLEGLTGGNQTNQENSGHKFDFSLNQGATEDFTSEKVEFESCNYPILEDYEMGSSEGLEVSPNAENSVNSINGIEIGKSVESDTALSFATASDASKPLFEATAQPGPNYSLIEGFLKKLRKLREVRQQQILNSNPITKLEEQPLPEVTLFAFQLVLGLLIPNLQSNVVSQVFRPIWYEVSGHYPSVEELNNPWELTAKLNLPTLALLSGELVIEQWKWDHKYLENYFDRDGERTLIWLTKILEELEKKGML